MTVRAKLVCTSCLIILLVVLVTKPFSPLRLHHHQQAVTQTLSKRAVNHPTLSFDRIYAVHLPARRDRRIRLNRLADGLGLNLTYSPAFSATHPVISRLIKHVRQQRIAEGWCAQASQHCTDQVKSLTLGSKPYLPDVYVYENDPGSGDLGRAGSDYWELSSTQIAKDPANHIPTPIAVGTDLQQVLDDALQSSNSTKPVAKDARDARKRVLSRAAVACWHSHVLALRSFVATGTSSALILEDDIDMEIDTHERLAHIWPAVPQDWDMVMLGHCWSKEDVHPPVSVSIPVLRPSFSPKCNHAYAVSRAGAMKLLRHLRSPTFAYSRPYDQAIVHLIGTSRVKSFSIVPSIVIQTKDTFSNIFDGTGSRWRAKLDRSALKELGIITT